MAILKRVGSVTCLLRILLSGNKIKVYAHKRCHIVFPYRKGIFLAPSWVDRETIAQTEENFRTVFGRKFVF